MGTAPLRRAPNIDFPSRADPARLIDVVGCCQASLDLLGQLFQHDTSALKNASAASHDVVKLPLDIRTAIGKVCRHLVHGERRLKGIDPEFINRLLVRVLRHAWSFYSIMGRVLSGLGKHHDGWLIPGRLSG